MTAAAIAAETAAVILEVASLAAVIPGIRK
jgi:hypothetical protein